MPSFRPTDMAPCLYIEIYTENKRKAEQNNLPNSSTKI